MSKKYNKKACALEYTVAMFGGKWKSIILWYLGTYGMHRYGEIKKLLPEITAKMLAQQLKELEADDLIIRTQYNEVPPRVEYKISAKGLTIMPIIELMYHWGEKHKNPDF